MQKILEEIFDTNGNFIDNNMNPYKDYDEDEWFSKIFRTDTEYGYSMVGSIKPEIGEVIEKELHLGKYHWSSDIVRCYYGMEMEKATKNNYNAHYMFR